MSIAIEDALKSFSGEDAKLLPTEYSAFAECAADIPTLTFPNQAALALGHVHERIPIDENDEPVLNAALFYLTHLVIRANRGAVVTIAAGYASESMPHLRRLVEFVARTSHMTGDSSGQAARLWLQGRGKKPSSIVDQEVWTEISPSSHADSSHLRWVLRPEDDSLLWFPRRRDFDGTLCLLVAILTLDVAVFTCEAVGLDPEPPDSLRRLVEDLIDKETGGTGEIEVPV